MTDHEKLEEIKKMCEAAFSASFSSNNIDLGRAQALANVYGVILYNGTNIIKPAQNEKAEDENQMTFDDLLKGDSDSIVDSIVESLAKDILFMPPVNGYLERTPITIADIARLKHKVDKVNASRILDDSDFSCVIEMSHADLAEVLGILHASVETDVQGGNFLFGVRVWLSPVDGIKVHILGKV